MATLRVSARVTDNKLDAVRRGLGRVCADWAADMAELQVSHHHAEAPVGRETYTDAQGHEHPGWLRDSVDAVELPGPSPSWHVQVHAFYGIYVNNGTRHQSANPFWDRATLRTEARADERLDTLTRQMLAGVAVR